ncbi:MAG: hypothetical protein LBT50_00700, partial [Prevotellaceae bacterium]|nr:hypothetical protein [Prevotellaceae bacterium]
IERNIFLHILEISDIDFQKKVWFGHSEKYVSSYVEVMCQLFDDDNYNLFLEKDAKSLNYTLSFRKKLQLLGDELNSFNREDNKDDLEIINDYQWQKISKLAKLIINEWTHLAEVINNV